MNFYSYMSYKLRLYIDLIFKHLLNKLTTVSFIKAIGSRSVKESDHRGDCRPRSFWLSRLCLRVDSCYSIGYYETANSCRSVTRTSNSGTLRNQELSRVRLLHHTLNFYEHNLKVMTMLLILHHNDRCTRTTGEYRNTSHLIFYWTKQTSNLQSLRFFLNLQIIGLADTSAK